MVTPLECQQHLPDVSAFHIESRARLEEVTLGKFLKHCVIILGVVASDVPNLEKIYQL